MKIQYYYQLTEEYDFCMFLRISERFLRGTRHDSLLLIREALGHVFHRGVDTYNVLRDECYVKASKATGVLILLQWCHHKDYLISDAFVTIAPDCYQIWSNINLTVDDIHAGYCALSHVDALHFGGKIAWSGAFAARKEK